MAGSVSVVTTGLSGPLVLATVTPMARENCAVRGVRVDCLSGSTVKVSTGFRLGTRHLIAPDSTSSRNYRAAVRDGNGLWTEWSDTVSLSAANFSAGSTDASCGSGATSDADIQSPSIVFPLMAHGSSRMRARRTFVSEGPGWTSETRGSAHRRLRSVFNVKLDNLDPGEQQRLHRFWRCLGGPLRPFLFDYADPKDGTADEGPAARYTVKFRDPTLTSSLFGTDQTEMNFALIEVMDEPEGGNV